MSRQGETSHSGGESTCAGCAAGWPKDPYPTLDGEVLHYKPNGNVKRCTRDDTRTTLPQVES